MSKFETLEAARNVIKGLLSKNEGFVSSSHNTAYFNTLESANKATEGRDMLKVLDLSSMPDWKDFFATPFMVEPNF